MWSRKEGRMTSTLSLSYDQACYMHPPSVECYGAQAFSINFDFVHKLMPKEKNQIAKRKVCTVIQSLLSRLPNHHSGHSYDRGKHHLFLTFPRGINIVLLDVGYIVDKLFGMNAGRPLSDVTPKWADSLAVSSRPLLQRAQSGMSAKPASKAQPARGNALQANRQVSKNSELFKKPKSSAQFHWERISSYDQPSRSSSGSELMPTIKSQYSSFLDRERSLDPRRLRRALQYSANNSFSPLCLRQLSALGLDFRRGKAFFTFCPYTISFVKDRPRKANLSASQWLSRSGIPKPPLQRRWWQTCLRTIGHTQSNLERDCFSAPSRALKREEYGQSIKGHGENVHSARLSLAF